MDEPSLYGRALAPDEINDLYVAGISGKCLVQNNTAPAVSAGVDMVIIATSEIQLNGQVSDDGLPLGRRLSLTWSVLDGPGAVTFADAASAQTTAGFTVPGIYLLELQAYDGQLTTADSLQVRYQPEQFKARRLDRLVVW